MIVIVSGKDVATEEQPSHDFDATVINIVQALKGEQSWWLMTVQMGCLGAISMKTMFFKHTVKG